MESLLDSDALSILFQSIFPGLLKPPEAGTGSWPSLLALTAMSGRS